MPFRLGAARAVSRVRRCAPHRIAAANGGMTQAITTTTASSRLCTRRTFQSSACVTVNIYFPAAAVERAADQIVKETWGGPGEPAKKDEPQSGIIGVEPVGNYAVRISFDDLHDTGIFSWSYLYELGERQQELWAAYLEALAARGLSREPRG